MKLATYSSVLALFFHTWVVASTPAEFNDNFKLLPQPQKVELISGKGLFYTDLRGVHLQEGLNRPVMTGLLANLPLIGYQSAGSVSLVINDKLGLPSREGYQLEVVDGRAIVQAMDLAGLFYGIQTLSQLLEDSQDQQIEIPACRITDYPEIAYRAVHLDLKHHIDAGHYYYSMIDRLASIKVNAIIIEFEDKLRYRKSPLVGAPNAISIEEFAALSKYAKDRHIEISPLIQGLGHASFILKHDEYKSLRDDPESDWVFDPLNPATYDLQFSLYEDAIAATPYGKYLHVGGDEVGTLGKSALSKASGMKPLELQMYWLKKVTDFAQQHNRIPIFWDDMVFKLADLYKTTYDASIPAQEVVDQWKKNRPLLDKSLSLFPKECVYMRWNYDDPMLPGNQMAIDWYKANNLAVMAATSAQTYSSMFPLTIAQFQPIKKFCQLTSEKKMSGILCTIWDDTSPHLEVISRGVFDFALFSWNYEDIPMEKAHVLFQQRFYGAALAKPSFNFQDLLEEGTTPFWATAFLQKGDREVYHKTFDLITLPDTKNKGAWSKKYSEKLSKAKEVRLKQTEIVRQLEMANELARRNQYALSLFSVINELQTYTSDVLLQLQQYDQASEKEQKSKALQIKKTLESFPAIRARFEEAYGKTRIMGNPPGYQLDSNFHHHLANGTNTTDWIFIYEIAMNEKLHEWLVQAAPLK
ncbi:MAG TPA: family 20 glycosylhydrolase [Chryseolinea sp.]